MFSAIAKSGAQVALATMIGATGFGIAATHESNVSAGTSTQIEAPRPSTAQISGDVQSTLDSSASTDVKKPDTPDTPKTRRPRRIAADATATASATVNGAVDSAPPAPAPPSTEPTPAPNPPSAGGSSSIDVSANVGLSGQIGIVGRHRAGAVDVGSGSNGSGTLHLSTGS